MSEYWRLEATSEAKHDLINGRMLRSPGVSPRHCLVSANTIAAIGRHLKGSRCRIYASNLRLGIPNRSIVHYPDASIICGEVELDSRDPLGHTAANPTAIVEVLDPSTATDDRSEKFDHYRDLPAFREYVLVFQDRREVHTFFKHDDGTWAFNVITDAPTVNLHSVRVELSINEIYDGVVFDVEPESTSPTE